jgi:enterochelin esterase-like enzyme
MGYQIMNAIRFQFVSALLLLNLCVGEFAIGDVKVIDLGGDQFMAHFSLDAPPDATSVHVAGSFNQWDPKTLAMKGPDANGQFILDVPLSRGYYEYKFVVNQNDWITDPDNPVRTGPNENAVLLAGLDPGTHQGPNRATPHFKMPGQLDHPKAIRDLIDQCNLRQTTDASPEIDAWFQSHSMPYFTENSVSFVVQSAHDKAVRLTIIAPGGRFGYELTPLVSEPPAMRDSLYGITLERDPFPAHSAYLLELVGRTRTRRIVDPNAWSVTSRDGRPAGKIIEPSTDVGRIELIENLATPDGKVGSRDVYVYLPPGYGANANERYPVVYLHDGQNCWDDPSEPFGHGGWSINLIADELIASKTIKPFIAVGIANTPDRLKEYGPDDDILSADSHAYLQFIIKTVKPLIDEKYRTRSGPQDTALMGSSMGGAISFQGALLMPEVFGSAACLSTAFLFKDSHDKGYAELVEQRGKQPVRLYLDSGTAGKHQDGAPATRAMVELLTKTGWKPGIDLEHFEAKGADHNERAWRARVDRPLRFLFAVK